jgi:hypothetical protein
LPDALQGVGHFLCRGFAGQAQKVARLLQKTAKMQIKVYKKVRIFRKRRQKMWEKG